MKRREALPIIVYQLQGDCSESEYVPQYSEINDIEEFSYDKDYSLKLRQEKGRSNRQSSKVKTVVLNYTISQSRIKRLSKVRAKANKISQKVKLEDTKAIKKQEANSKSKGETFKSSQVKNQCKLFKRSEDCFSVNDGAETNQEHDKFSNIYYPK